MQVPRTHHFCDIRCVNSLLNFRHPNATNWISNVVITVKTSGLNVFIWEHVCLQL